ncbi:hypothetical protein FA13DRAFT_1704649 [Coprinellus micaceus]|uniref:Uncharacterized protein n=1 Tax=Coprinellus micaceus TaxID=71717 RepID=A0A4Y7TZP8_COPMI|nr:hypothetical protein FA13DRAFT_1704649 [Coprinellus micaceus]
MLFGYSMGFLIGTNLNIYWAVVIFKRSVQVCLQYLGAITSSTRTRSVMLRCYRRHLHLDATAFGRSHSLRPPSPISTCSAPRLVALAVLVETGVSRRSDKSEGTQQLGQNLGWRGGGDSTWGDFWGSSWGYLMTENGLGGPWTLHLKSLRLMAAKELSGLFVQAMEEASLHSLQGKATKQSHRFMKSLLQYWTRSNEQPIPEPHSVSSPYSGSSIFTELKERAKKHGGSTLFLWKCCRLLGCVLLLSLSIYTAVSTEDSHGYGTHGKGTLRDRRTRSRHSREMQDLGLCLASLYAVFLSILTVGNKCCWSRISNTHLNLFLLAFFGAYAYRDVFPFATFDRFPEDWEEGRTLWAKVAILFLIALAYPLGVPWQYIPVNPEEPMKTPNAEQTASLFSLATYTFLDRVVVLGN